jgi:hypothetical protein
MAGEVDTAWYGWPTLAERSRNTWKLSSSFTATLLSGTTTINPLVQQAIGTCLGDLLTIDTVRPSVLVYTLPQAGHYFVDASYPTHVEGHRRLADGTLCLEAVPVAIPQVRQQGDQVAETATASLVTGSAWMPAVVAAADAFLGVDVVTSLQFTVFHVVERPVGCVARTGSAVSRAERTRRTPLRRK